MQDEEFIEALRRHSTSAFVVLDVGPAEHGTTLLRFRSRTSDRVWALEVPLPSATGLKPWQYAPPDDASESVGMLGILLEEEVLTTAIDVARSVEIDGATLVELAPYGLQRADEAEHARLAAAAVAGGWDGSQGVGGWPERVHPLRAEDARALREEPQRRPGAMRPEERERLVRIGLGIVLGDRAGALSVRRLPDDTIDVRDDLHGFGFPPDVVLGDDPRTVLEHDVEWLIDELCETAVAWAERLPRCPIHPDAHPLDVLVGDGTITASCPMTGEAVRSTSY